MPVPKKGETQDEFIGRCIPMMIGEGHDKDQASAICYSKWEQRTKKSLETKEFVFEIKSVEEDDNEELIIEGYGSKFGNVDSYKDIVASGAFKKTIKENSGRIAFCYQHDIYTPIGKILSIKEDENGLLISVRISDAEKDIKTKIREGILKEMSIGYSTVRCTVDSKTGIRTLEEVKLWEVSLVTLAANPLATITAMKSVDEKKDIVIEQIDRIVAITHSRELKFELTKLKALIEELPNESQDEEKPPMDVTNFKKVDFSKLTFKE